MDLPTPHGDKLNALLNNPRLPSSDMKRVSNAIKRYQEWRESVENSAYSQQTMVQGLVSVLNEYRNWLDVDLIFNSGEDFLYRQKGQLKLDNSVLEEFLPLLVNLKFPAEVARARVELGPRKAFSQLHFDGDMVGTTLGGGIKIRSKDHDFAISQPLFLRASHDFNFRRGITVELNTSLAFLAAEIKTNLDKTMFQEASATAHDLKIAVPGSRYLLLCEWLDMTPISSSVTAIEEVIILRKAKRLSSNVRSEYSSVEGRRKHLEEYRAHLVEHPLQVSGFERFLEHVKGSLCSSEEEDVVRQGWF